MLTIFIWERHRGADRLALKCRSQRTVTLIKNWERRNNLIYCINCWICKKAWTIWILPEAFQQTYLKFCRLLNISKNVHHFDRVGEYHWMEARSSAFWTLTAEVHCSMCGYTSSLLYLTAPKYSLTFHYRVRKIHAIVAPEWFHYGSLLAPVLSCKEFYHKADVVDVLLAGLSQV